MSSYFCKRSGAIAGMLFSGLLSGVLADVRGRRYTLLFGLVCNAFVGVASALARNATELCLLRFMCGLGLGMVISGVVTLSAEISPPSCRGRFMTLVASCYTLGFLYTAFWALIIFRAGSGSWRLFMFVNAIPTICAAILAVMFVPESPRFFLSRGRLRDSVDVANTIVKRLGGDGNDLLTFEELRRYLFQAKQIGVTSFRAKEVITVNEDNLNSHEYGTLHEEIRMSLSSMSQVFTNRMYRITIPLQLTYACLTLVTGVATWWTKIFQGLELTSDAYSLSFYHTLAQIPGMMLASGLIDIVGRRRLVIIGFGGGTVTLFLFSVFANSVQAFESNTRSAVALGLACCYSICLCVGWLALDCLSTESFPTKVRSTGRGVCVATGRIAGFSIQFLYGPLINENRLGYMLGIACMFAVCGVIISYQTTDTTNVDLQDHWEGGKAVELPCDDANLTDRRYKFL
ncbi:hypothetical protein HJC23_012107 [Cyclotella cryptica]|uniref:Major facilitator superfamily (MFS) profile domain-containing protein n=1 Tax=Cyclotella cryptica TaxID=29204 RepID=A0ABD3P4E8_9STRA